MRNRKALTSNILSFLLSDLAVILIPLLTMPILSRVLGSNAYGEYLLFTTIIVFGHTIIDYSVNINGVREVAKSRNDKSGLEESFVNYQSLRCILCILYVATISIFFAIGFFATEKLAITLTCLVVYLIGYVLAAPWYMLATDRASRYSAVVLGSRFVLLFIVLFCIEEPTDFNLLMFASSFPFFICSIILRIFSRVEVAEKFYKINTSTLKTKFKEGLNSFVGIISPNFYNTIPILLLGGIIPPFEFAFFSLASRISSLCVTAQNVLIKASFPLISRNFNLRGVFLLIISTAILSGIFSIVTFSFGKEIISFTLTEEFLPVYDYILLFIPGLIFVGAANSIIYGYVLPQKFDKKFRNITVKVSTFSLFSGLVLVIAYESYGVAMLISLARFFLFLGFLQFFLRREK